MLACLEVVGPGGQHEQRSANGAPQHDAVGALGVCEYVGQALIWHGHVGRAGPEDGHRQR